MWWVLAQSGGCTVGAMSKTGCSFEGGEIGGVWLSDGEGLCEMGAVVDEWFVFEDVDEFKGVVSDCVGEST